MVTWTLTLEKTKGEIEICQPIVEMRPARSLEENKILKIEMNLEKSGFHTQPHPNYVSIPHQGHLRKHPSPN